MNKKLLEKIKTLPQTGFYFDEEDHLYLMDGKPLTGVTTILSVIAKPSLIQWAADEAVKYLGWINQKYDNSVETYLGFVKFWQENIKGKNADEFFNLLCEARTQHAKRKKDAGNIGTEAHKQVEHYVKGEPFDAMTDQVALMVKNFTNWAEENKVKFLESEKKLWSKEHWFAGTVDLVFEMDGKRYIGDIKTSSGIYNEAFFQMGGYEIALEEMGYQKVDGYLVINLKKDGTMDLKVSENREVNKEAFKHALGLYKIINSLE